MSEVGEGRPLFLRRFSWVMFTLTLAVLPHLQHLPLWASAAFLGLGGYRLAAARWRLPLPGQIVRLLAALISVVLVLITYRTLNGQEAGTALLVMMIAIKFTETVAKRDLILLIFMGYFLVISTFLYTQSIPIALFMIPTVLVVTATLLQVTRAAPRTHDPRPALREASRLLLHALPMMLILFVLFPRIPGPLWGLTARTSGVTGLSGEMTPGDIANLSLSDEIAFRVRFEGEPPPRNQWYWRGPVFHEFNGRRWDRGQRLQFAPVPPTREGTPTTYTVTLEPHQQHWLFALDYPTDIPSEGRLRDDYVFYDRNPVVNLKRYTVTSWPDGRITQPAIDPDRPPRSPDAAWSIQRDLQVPRALINPRTRELGQRWREEEGDDDLAIVLRALEMFREQPFIYTLRPPLMRQSPSDEFLFEERRGFCEHYASSFVLLMRSAGIPSRVVTGYQGGEYNPVSEDYVVRQSDAHAWAEVWLGDQGWTRVDPTGAVAPDRIELGLADALPEGEFDVGLFGRYDFLTMLEVRWEAMNSFWDEFILGYGPDAQSALLDWFGFEDLDWRGITVLMVAALGLFTLWLTWRLLRELHPGRQDPSLRLYRRFLKKLAKRGVERRPAEGPLDFAARAARERPELAEAITEVTDCYLKWRYHSREVPAILRAMRLRVAAL